MITIASANREMVVGPLHTMAMHNAETNITPAVPNENPEALIKLRGAIKATNGVNMPNKMTIGPKKKHANP
jgi:hypothetical protein